MAATKVTGDGSALTGVVDTSVRASTGTLLSLSGGTMTGNLSSNYIVTGSTMGTAGQTVLYGDGSHLTGITGGGSSGWVGTATSDLNMSGYQIVNASSITA